MTAFVEDATERPGVVVPGVVPATGEKRQHAISHCNDTPGANCNASWVAMVGAALTYGRGAVVEARAVTSIAGGNLEQGEGWDKEVRRGSTWLGGT